MRAGLVGDDVELLAPREQVGQRLRRVGYHTDRPRAAFCRGLAGPAHALLERRRHLVEVPRLDPSLHACRVDVEAECNTAVEGDREWLRAAHPAESGGQHDPAAQRPVVPLLGDGRERLEGSLHDALRADVDPRPRRHLAVHRQPQRLELPEVLPRRPARHEQRVGDEHPWRVREGAEDRDRLPALHEQRLVVRQPHQCALDGCQ